MNQRFPDEETLAAYFEGLLDPATEAAVQRAIREDPALARLAAALGAVLEDAPLALPSDAPEVPVAFNRAAVALWKPDASPIQRALQVAVRWVGDHLAPLSDALAPLPAQATMMRGSEAATALDHLRYHLDLGDLPIEIDLETDGPGLLSLTVRPRTPPAGGLLLRLTEGDETRAHSTLDDRGTTISALTPGDYELTLEPTNAPPARLTLTLRA